VYRGNDVYDLSLNFNRGCAELKLWSLENGQERENGTCFRLGHQEDGVKRKRNLEAAWAGQKVNEAECRLHPLIHTFSF